MTCGEHAKIMAALVPPDQMGPKTKAVYDRLMAQEHEECIAAESQVVHLFMSAVAADNGGGAADESWSRAMDWQKNEETPE